MNISGAKMVFDESIIFEVACTYDCNTWDGASDALSKFISQYPEMATVQASLAVHALYSYCTLPEPTTRQQIYRLCRTFMPQELRDLPPKLDGASGPQQLEVLCALEKQAQISNAEHFNMNPSNTSSLGIFAACPTSDPYQELLTRNHLLHEENASLRGQLATRCEPQHYDDVMQAQRVLVEQLYRNLAALETMKKQNKGLMKEKEALETLRSKEQLHRVVEGHSVPAQSNTSTTTLNAAQIQSKKEEEQKAELKKQISAILKKHERESSELRKQVENMRCEVLRGQSDYLDAVKRAAVFAEKHQATQERELSAKAELVQLKKQFLSSRGRSSSMLTSGSNPTSPREPRGSDAGDETQSVVSVTTESTHPIIHSVSTSDVGTSTEDLAAHLKLQAVLFGDSKQLDSTISLEKTFSSGNLNKVLTGWNFEKESNAAAGLNLDNFNPQKFQEMEENIKALESQVKKLNKENEALRDRLILAISTLKIDASSIRSEKTDQHPWKIGSGVSPQKLAYYPEKTGSSDGRRTPCSRKSAQRLPGKSPSRSVKAAISGRQTPRF